MKWVDLGLNYLDSFRKYPEYIGCMLQVWAISKGIFDKMGRYMNPYDVCMDLISLKFQLFV